MMEPSVATRMAVHFLIQEQLFSFCHAVDSKRFDNLEKVFLTSATGDYGKGRTVGSLAELVASMRHNLGEESNCGPSQHNVLNLRITPAIDEKWESTAHFYAVHEGRGQWEGLLWKTWGEYRDIWTLTEEGWKIRHRNYQTFFSEGPVEIVSRQ